MLEKIRKLEALARSTTSKAESQAAFRAASRLKSRYRKLLETKPFRKKYTQDREPCKEYFSDRFCVYCISERRCNELIHNIQLTNAMRLEGENRISWIMEKFVFRSFFFCRKVYVDLHITFSSTSQFALRKMIDFFLSRSELAIKDGGEQANRE